MNERNIFYWATSELSQDAFICWLLSWLKPENGDDKLHKVASLFFNKLTNNRINEINSIDIRKQYLSIDIVCIINEKYAILIEDKIHANNSKGQLEGYLKALSSKYKMDNIFPVYLKTGDQGNLNTVSKLGYKIFTRKNFINVLETGIHDGITNNIFVDFYNSLCFMEESVNSFRTLPLSEWHWDSWKGFYNELLMHFPDGEWNYIPQKNGGFLGFWWCWGYKETDDSAEFDYYLQLEQTKFCFKIYPYKRTQAEDVRRHFRHVLYNRAKESSINVYQNGRIGEYMTVAALNDNYIKTNDKGIIDIDNTISTIKSVEKMMKNIYAN